MRTKWDDIVDSILEDTSLEDLTLTLLDKNKQFRDDLYELVSRTLRANEPLDDERETWEL